MKGRREHRVPLSRHALKVLAEAHAPRSEWVLLSATGLMLTSMDFSGLLKTLRLGAAPHGSRSSFQDWAVECIDAPHAVRDKVEAVYVRSDLFERCRVLMEQWAEYLSGRGVGNGA